MANIEELIKQLQPILIDRPFENNHSRYSARTSDYRTVLIHNIPFLFTCNEQDHTTILEHHSIAIKDGTITDVLPAEKIDQKNFDLVYDAGKRGGIVVTPGLVNTHTHPPMYLMRSAMMLDEGEGVDETIAAMPKWERAMEDEHFTIAAISDITEEQKHGITATLSHYGVFMPIEHAAALTQQNIVNALSVVSNSHPENTPALMYDLLEKRDSFTSIVAASLHYLYKADAPVLDQIYKMIDQYGILFTCHLAESEMVAEKCFEKHGMYEIDLLEKHGLLNENTVVSHVIHVSDDDIQKIARSHVGVSHLPTSNIIHKSGTFAFWKFEEAGALPYLSLGTDSVVSKSRLDILTEAYQTRITHLYDRTVKFSSLFKMMTTNGARVLHEPLRGKIVHGHKADLCFWKLKDRGFVPYDETNPITLLGNIITHGGRYVRDLMINGKFIIKDRKHLLVDESRLLEETQRAHMQMRERVKNGR